MKSGETVMARKTWKGCQGEKGRHGYMSVFSPTSLHIKPDLSSPVPPSHTHYFDAPLQLATRQGFLLGFGKDGSARSPSLFLK